ncbi:hypothetical protein RFI_35037, partial [Reticulomyxa filosa]
MNVDKNQHEHAKVWRYIKQLHKWEIYNFEQELEKKTSFAKNNSVYFENEEAQFKKLDLLLRICGGYQTNDENKRKIKVEQLLKKHNDYALTFDNILKIVAIFFRLKSSIPVLIMGETGCGKTKLLKFMASALNIQMTSIDVHGGYTVEDLQRDLEDPLQEASRNPKCTYL